MKNCFWCSGEFKPNVKYQVYCSPECRIQATKEKTNERYQKKKREKLAGQERRCKSGCGTILSMYNDSGFCSACVVNEKKVNRALEQLRGIIEYQRFDR